MSSLSGTMGVRHILPYAKVREGLPLAPVLWRRLPFWKRLFDLAGSLAGLIVLSPLLVLLAVIIKCISPRGPVLFRQERLGYGGQPFICYKFRTMRPDCDASIHREHAAEFIRKDQQASKLDGSDPRLLPFALLIRACGLDELPQLFNVLRGEMSLVGPRPCLAYEAECFDQWQRRRFDVQPGITGLWQVSGKNKTSFKEEMRLDIRYVENRSLVLDMKILLSTLPVVVGLVYDAIRKQFRRNSKRQVQSSYALDRSNIMKTTNILLFAFLPLLFSTGCRTTEIADPCQLVAMPPAETNELVLARGDEIEIKFRFNPELDDVQVIRPDGLITLPYVGNVMAAGKTPSVLIEDLREAYSEELREAVINVVVRSMYERRVYVAGAVRTPGVVFLPGQLTVLEAIMEAGGVDTFHGDVSNVVIMRVEGGRRIGCKLDYEDMFKTGNGQAFMLQSQDIVYVSRTPISNLNQWVDQYINRLLPRMGVGVGSDGNVQFNR